MGCPRTYFIVLNLTDRKLAVPDPKTYLRVFVRLLVTTAKVTPLVNLKLQKT